MATNLITKAPCFRKIRSNVIQFWNRDGTVRKFCAEAASLNGATSEFQESRENDCESFVTAVNSFGKPMIISAGKLAKLADGCATVTFGNTTVMSTVVSKTRTEGDGFVPLTVSYQQKSAALGRIPLNFLRRELGVTESEILTSRVIDRSLRPLFPYKFNWDTQIVCNPLALDGSNFSDVLAINAASAALTVSDVPWNGPVGAVRIGLIGEEVIVNPGKREIMNSSLNLIVACREKKLVLMLEGWGYNVLQSNFLKAINIGIRECQVIVKAIESLRKKCGKKKRVFTPPQVNSELYEAVRALAAPKLQNIFQNYNHDKLSRDKEVTNLKESVLDNIKDSFSNENPSQVSDVFHDVCKEVFRELIFQTGTRCDGRSLNQLRDILCEAGLYKPLHGSALFQRGQTQVLCTVVLDSPNSSMKMDRISMATSGIKEKNFFVHYEFPPFATKEVGRMGPVGRREIGHGVLAEKALKGNIPANFPFTIRLTSEVLESNGSSSMATVCGGSLALMDAGVPIENACAGVAMGLVVKYSKENPSEIEDYRVLTDILGIEDHFGDIDFKIAGTKKAITAVQLDVKNSGLPLKIIVDCIQEARMATNEIIKKMNSVYKQPRTDKKDTWPVMEKLNVPIHLRGQFVGPGGMNLKKLEMDIGVEITETNPGEFNIFAPNVEAMNEAKDIIDRLLESNKEVTLEFGGVYTATIVEIKNTGCMVTLYPNMQPAHIHLSQLDLKKVAHPSALGLEVGQEIQVKYFGRDPVSGYMRLSRKVLQGTTSQVVQNFVRKDPPQEEKLDGKSTIVKTPLSSDS